MKKIFFAMMLTLFVVVNCLAQPGSPNWVDTKALNKVLYKNSLVLAKMIIKRERAIQYLEQPERVRVGQEAKAKLICLSVNKQTDDDINLLKQVVPYLYGKERARMEKLLRKIQRLRN